ncbi:LysE family translocator [Pseudomonas sp. SAR267]|uniref:LysE family translocator n=1 Tax=Pseudomonas TaxID=286 RepID=UPI000C1A2C54|nr:MULTISPECIES: LysE family transporter [unclassified Pseudomonas]MBS3188435.1 LysE family transporter [Pseudomonas sp. PCH44]PIK77345.1 lysine transporter LysE [Pseudomonas sp. 382]
MDYVPQLLTIGAVMLLACVSPGPDFIAVTSNALVSRSRGMGVAVGTSAGIAIWAVLAIVGLGVLLSTVAWLYDAIRVVGAGYLIYMGIKMLLGARRPYAALEISTTQNTTTAAPRVGLLVSVTNPKAAAFFGSFFITVLPTHAPGWVMAAAVVVVTLVAFAWFSMLALMFSTARVQVLYTKVRRPIDAAMGAVLVGLGLRLALVR